MGHGAVTGTCNLLWVKTDRPRAGTRLWYAFYGLASESDALLEERMDAVCREIGDRGRPHEAIPPEPAPRPVASAVPAPAPAPAPSLQPELPPSAALSLVADHEQGFTPSVRSGLATVAAPEQVGPGRPAAAADAALHAEAPHFAALAGQMLARADAREARLEALVEARDRELLALRDDMARQGARAVAAAVTADELADFQARTERLHAAELIGAEELHSCAPRPLSSPAPCVAAAGLSKCCSHARPPNRRLEDAVGDYVELGSAHRAEGLPAVDRLRRMVAASAAFRSDEALARQLRRQLQRR